MTFQDYIRKCGYGELKELERRSGVSYTTLLKLNRGATLKNVDVARAVSRGTDGRVSVLELLGIEPPEPDKLTGGLEDWLPDNAS